MAEKEVKVSIYLDNRLHLVIEHIAKCNRFEGKDDLDTINKILIQRLNIFCDMVEKSPEQIETFIQRTYALDVFDKDNQRQLKKSFGRTKKPYPFSIPISLRDRFDKVYEDIVSKIGFRMSKLNLHNIIYLDYVMSVREEIKKNWIQFMNQDYFSPFVAEKEGQNLDLSISISKPNENLEEKNKYLEGIDKVKEDKILEALSSITELLSKK